MASKAKKERRLARLNEICLALPLATHEYKHAHVAFLVGKKTFAYYLDDHHGDGIVSLCCKVLAGENRLLASQDPERFYLPAYIASRGWVGLRLDRVTVNWAEVKELVHASYLQIAPNKPHTLTKRECMEKPTHLHGDRREPKTRTAGQIDDLSVSRKADQNTNLKNI